MHGKFKEKVVSCLEQVEFYPAHVIEQFLSEPKRKNSRNWVKQLCNKHRLINFIDCKDAKFYGNTDVVAKNKRAYYAICGITSGQMEKFEHLNYLLLIDVFKKTRRKVLHHYYNMIVCLNGGEDTACCVLFERRKLDELVHKTQAKLINDFVNKPPRKKELRDFIIITILFSQADLSHDEATRENFLKLCQMV